MSSIATPSPPAPGSPEPDSSLPVPAPPGRTPARRSRVPRLPERGRPSPSLLAFAGVAGILLLTTFAQRAGNALGPKTLVEIVLIVLGGAVVATALVRARRPFETPGLIAIVLFGLLAALTALSIGWAVNPSDGWLTANRLFSYTAVFAGAAALARLRPAVVPSVVGAIAFSLTIVCGYGLLTKALPGQLQEFELFARLREPFGYWNAVGLAGVLALPPLLWLGARRDGAPALNALAAPAISLCLAATLMAYSRGALVAAAIGLAVWFALVPLRLRGVTVLAIGGVGGALIAVWSFGQDALTTDRAPLDERTPAGTELLILTLAVILLVYVVALAASFVAEVRDVHALSRKRIGAVLVVLAACLPFAAAGALAMTDAGLKGSIENALGSLTDTEAVGPANDPGRLIDTGSVRGRYWQQAFKVWESEPVLGTGAGGYSTGRLRYREDLLDVRHAHGYIPETMAELGLVGLVLSFLVLGAWGVAGWQAIRAAMRRRSTAELAALGTLVSVAVTFGAHSMIDFTWAVPGVALVALVAAGWIAGRGTLPVELPAPAAPAAGPEPATAVAVAESPSRSRFGALRTPRAVAAGGVVALVAVAAWSVWQPMWSQKASDASITALSDGNLEEARRQADLARDRNPLSIEPLLDIAAIEGRARRPREAEQALIEATRVQPQNWLPWQRLADLRLFDLDDPQGAVNASRVALYLNPRSWDVVQRFIDARRRAAEAAAGK